MARIQGYRCDGPNCQTVTETEDIPHGWITVTVHVDPEAAGRDPERTIRTIKSTANFHLCSNGCLFRLGRERWKAAVDRGDEKGARPAGKKRESA